MLSLPEVRQVNLASIRHKIGTVLSVLIAQAHSNIVCSQAVPPVVCGPANALGHQNAHQQDAGCGGAPPSSSPVPGSSVRCLSDIPGLSLSRDVRTGKVLAVVVAIDRSDEVLDNGFFVEPNFTGSDQ